MGEREGVRRTPAPRRTTSGSWSARSSLFTGTEALSCHELLLGLRAGEVLGEQPRRLRGIGVGVHDRAGRVDRGRLAGRAGRELRDAEVDARRLVRRHQPRAVDLHRGQALLEGVAGLGEDRRVGHDLVLPDEVLEELDPAGGLRPVERDFVPSSDRMSPPVLPHERGPGVLHVGRLGVQAPLVDRAVAVGVRGQLLADLDQLVPGPGVVRDTGSRPRRTWPCCSRARSTLRSRGRPNRTPSVGREVLDRVVGELAEVVALARR